jgi:hypothetical protein
MTIDTPTAGEQAAATAPGSGDTSVLDTFKAAAPDLAWSQVGDNAELDFCADPPRSVATAEFSAVEDEPVGRYSWWLVWLRAVLLVVGAAALAAALVFVLRGWHAPAPAAAPQSPSADSDPFLREEAGVMFYNSEDICRSIAAGHTPQQLEAQMVAPDYQGWPTLAQARDYINEAIRTHCPASATHH